ncbi:MAG: GNAT family N-acetyltransferase [Flavobacteriales bacterium]|nr:GNAT family N-acetyltransferase [Flavobacteriales bacterium]
MPPIVTSPLRATDIAAAFALATETPAVHGALLWHVHTAYARGYKAMVGPECVGFILGMAHATSAWINELYVRPTWMEHGVGTALLHEQLRWAQARGATTHQALVLPAAVSFFRHRGFHARYGLLAYSGGTHVEASDPQVVPLEPQHLLGVAHLDRRASGEDRSNWLREHSYLGVAHVAGHRVRGYYLPLADQGLIVADEQSIGLELQRWCLPLQSTLRLPVGNAAHDHLIRCGYSASPAATRMWHGTPSTDRQDMLYGM